MTRRSSRFIRFVYSECQMRVGDIEMIWRKGRSWIIEEHSMNFTWRGKQHFFFFTFYSSVFSRFLTQKLSFFSEKKNLTRSYLFEVLTGGIPFNYWHFLYMNFSREDTGYFSITRKHDLECWLQFESSELYSVNSYLKFSIREFAYSVIWQIALSIMQRGILILRLTWSGCCCYGDTVQRSFGFYWSLLLAAA